MKLITENFEATAGVGLRLGLLFNRPHPFMTRSRANPEGIIIP